MADKREPPHFGSKRDASSGELVWVATQTAAPDPEIWPDDMPIMWSKKTVLGRQRLTAKEMQEPLSALVQRYPFQVGS